MFTDKIKSLIEKNLKGNSKKTIENLIVFLILLVITVISINVIWGKNNNQRENAPKEDSSYAVLAQDITDTSNNLEKDEYNLERELESILSKISGVGKIQVLITYSETSEIVAMHNEVKSISKTEENDSNRWYKSNRIN